MHIEPTSRCTLACPACPRTQFIKKFKRPFPKQDLNLQDLWHFLDCDTGKKVSQFTLNGNHGDPIYYPDLFKLIDLFRNKVKYKISTNGSYQPESFWHNLGDRLTSDDTIYFSIDGLEHNNHLYRRNSDWNSIMAGLDIMLSKTVKVVWKTLYFSYNEFEIDQIEKLAKDKGCIFVVEPTSRFGDPKLEPSKKYIETTRVYKPEEKTLIEPQCFSQEYISADGYYWPCCLITGYNTLHQTTLWKNRDQWAIKNKSLDETRILLNDWYKKITDDLENASPLCKMHCKPGQKFVWSSV